MSDDSIEPPQSGGRRHNGNSRDDKVVSLGRDIQVKIGQHLRTMYDEVVKQGVPDHLNELLQRLDESTDKSAGRK
jgi:hypothetical protein